MSRLSARDKTEYYHKCYKTVDGLWFVKAEEKYGFDTALELDREVWEVVPKIQARFIKKRLGAEDGLGALEICFSEKLKLDGFEFTTDVRRNENKITRIEFQISVCPWHDILVGSKRENISDKIGSIICGTEYEVWASEFGEDIRFSFGKSRICRGNSGCIFSYSTEMDKK